MKMLLAATSEHRLTWQFMQSTTDRPAALSKTRLGMTRQKTPAAKRCPCSTRIVRSTTFVSVGFSEIQRQTSNWTGQDLWPDFTEFMISLSRQTDIIKAGGLYND